LFSELIKRTSQFLFITKINNFSNKLPKKDTNRLVSYRWFIPLAQSGSHRRQSKAVRAIQPAHLEHEPTPISHYSARLHGTAAPATTTTTAYDGSTA